MSETVTKISFLLTFFMFYSIFPSFYFVKNNPEKFQSTFKNISISKRIYCWKREPLLPSLLWAIDPTKFASWTRPPWQPLCLSQGFLCQEVNNVRYRVEWYLKNKKGTPHAAPNFKGPNYKIYFFKVTLSRAARLLFLKSQYLFFEEKRRIC